jgi:hypothetical protein
VRGGPPGAYFVVFQDRTEDVSDVQRFITLTEEARRQVAPGFSLFDGDMAAATTAAIVRFQRKKAEARRALVAKQALRNSSVSWCSMASDGRLSGGASSGSSWLVTLAEFQASCL